VGILRLPPACHRGRPKGAPRPSPVDQVMSSGGSELDHSRHAQRARADRSGVNAYGYREILGVDVSSAEDGAGKLTFLRSLSARGLSGVRLVTSNADAGLVGRDRGDDAGCGPAALQNALDDESDGRHHESVVAVGQNPAAFRVRSARILIRWGAI